MHEQLFTFSLETECELYNLRAIVQGRESMATAETLAEGTGDSAGAVYEKSSVFFGGKDYPAEIYDRAKLKSGDRVTGPAIITEMDSTTLILPDHTGQVDQVGNILIRPVNGI